MANYFVKTYDQLNAAVNAANLSADNDSIYFQNDLTLTAAQIINLASPTGSGTLRFRGGTPAGFNGDGTANANAPANPINYTLTTVQDLVVNDTTAALATGANPPSFTIGPFTLKIGNGGTAGSLTGNIRSDDDGVLAFNKSTNTTYAGTYYLEEEAGLRNDVANTTVTFSNASSITSHVGNTGNPSSWDLEIDGVGDGVIQGAITDSYTATGTSPGLRQATGNIEKEGTGTWTFAGVNTYRGDTVVSEGTLLVTGSTSNSLTIVGEEGTLGGTGSVGNLIVESEGTVAAGIAGTANGVGTLNTRSIQLASDSVFDVELGGTANNLHDRLNVAGSVTLNGATLDLSLVGGFNLANGQVFEIITNDSSDAVRGTFADEDGNAIEQGGFIEFGDRSFVVSYQGGNGNDVTLTVNTPPVANDDTAQVAQRQAVSGNVVTGDTDANGGTLTVAEVAAGSDDGAPVAASGTTTFEGTYGTLTIAADGSYTYTANVEGAPPVGATATDVFTYTLSDGQGGEDTATLTVTVTGSANGNSSANTFDLTGAATSAAGGKGNDVYIVDQSSDQAIEAPNEGTDAVTSSASYTLGANVENLTLTGTGDIDGTGNALSNVLRGNGGNNVLAGGLGNDLLIGGGGNDTYLFNAAPGPGNVDHIRSFSVGGDTIALDNKFFKGLVNGALPEGAFKDITDGAELDAGDRILYDHDSGRLWIDADGSGSGARVQFAILDNHPTLTFQDFTVV